MKFADIEAEVTQHNLQAALQFEDQDYFNKWAQHQHYDYIMLTALIVFKKRLEEAIAEVKHENP